MVDDTATAKGEGKERGDHEAAAANSESATKCQEPAAVNQCRRSRLDNNQQGLGPSCKVEHQHSSKLDEAQLDCSSEHEIEK